MTGLSIRDPFVRTKFKKVLVMGDKWASDRPEIPADISGHKQLVADNIAARHLWRR